MTLLTQAEVELQMYRGGIERSTRMMATAEEHGEAARNPYAATLYRDFVLALSDLITEEVGRTYARRAGAHIALLKPLEPAAVALLAVRTTLNAIMNPTKGTPTLRQVASAVGSAVHQELVLAQIETMNPELYHTLANDFNRRRTKDVRHRLTVFRMQAQKAGITWAEWGKTDRDMIGVYLLEQLSRLQMVDIDPPPTYPDGRRMPGKMTNPLGVRLTQEVVETISRIKGFVSITSPVYGPCVEPPRDWSSFSGGGFHTAEMRRVHPYLVKAHATAREALRGHSMPTVYAAVNTLQKTAWRVNARLLAAIKEVGRYRNIGEIITSNDLPRPDAPEWLAETDASARTDAQSDEFMRWKHAMAGWYTDRKQRAAMVARYLAAMRAAEMFHEYPEIFFVYFADSRGRLYPLTYGLNPQGSDMQKALLQFAVGKPLLDDDAKRWFCIQGANKWGFDKAPLADRAAWHIDKHDLIMSFAADPLNNSGWEKADAPLQFLSWCFEYAEWQRLGDDFESRLPISMDGSCNGLQHFSAMLRDKVGGTATNLTDNEQMQDIYMIVARKAEELMRKHLEDGGTDEDGFIAKWIAHGVERSLVKRSVMTTPYGVTKRTAVSYVVEDYLRVGKAQMFDKNTYFKAAQAVMDFVWEAIGLVVIKSRQAMDWLRTSAGRIVKARGECTEGVISWETPSGFLATQAYYDLEEHQVRTRLHGSTRILVVSEADEASSRRHSSGLAPNFVHSMDAAHLHLTAASAANLGIDAIAMIHDDYGTHAADAQKLYTLIRVRFIEMYEDHDPIADFAKRFPECATPPGKGELDIKEVLYSHYFFS